jgi:hypothetical protein
MQAERPPNPHTPIFYRVLVVALIIVSILLVRLLFSLSTLGAL